MHSPPPRSSPAPGSIRPSPVRPVRPDLQENRPPEGPHEKDSQHLGLQQTEEPRAQLVCQSGPVADGCGCRGLDGSPTTRSSPPLPSRLRKFGCLKHKQLDD